MDVPHKIDPARLSAIQRQKDAASGAAATAADREQAFISESRKLSAEIERLERDERVSMDLRVRRELAPRIASAKEEHAKVAGAWAAARADSEAAAERKAAAEALYRRCAEFLRGHR